MARRKRDLYSTIEYIGPRPQKPKRSSKFGGWFIVVIALGIAAWFGRPLMPLLKAAMVPASNEQASLQILELNQSSAPSDQLAAAALAYATQDVNYQTSYQTIDYPMGDVAASNGGAADLVVRCLRKQGIDLQKEIHEDMVRDFRRYPQLWSATAPDANIDHRRVPNLHAFLERHATSLTPQRVPSHFKPGDLVVWSLVNGESHIGIAVPGPAGSLKDVWVVHHLGGKPKWENVLLDYPIIGHYRFPNSSK